VTSLRAVERHLARSSPLVESVRLVPLEGSQTPGAYRAEVVPSPAGLSAERTVQVRARLREVLEAAAASAPRPVRLEEVDVAPTPDGGAPSGPASEAGRHARARLEAVLGAGPLRPEQDLEADLGLDSLDLLSVRALLEDELGAPVADADLWRIRTVGDVLERAAAAGAAPGAPGTYDLSARLRELAPSPLDRRYDLGRSGLRHAAASAGMLLLTLWARLYFRLELRRAERLPARGPYLFCPTHQSMLDAPLLYGALPRPLVHRMVFLAFGPYFRAPPLSWLVGPGRLILTGEADSLADSLRLALEALRRGLVTCVFPEGRCSTDGAIQPPRPGVGLLACEAGVPIVPVLYQGSRRTCSPAAPGLRPTKIRLVVGDPIPPPAPRRFGRADYEAAAERWLEGARRLGAEHPEPR